MIFGTFIPPWNPLRYANRSKSLTLLDDCASFHVKFMINIVIKFYRSKSFQLERWNVPELSTGLWNGNRSRVLLNK
jgi:hypothetical protein